MTTLATLFPTCPARPAPIGPDVGIEKIVGVPLGAVRHDGIGTLGDGTGRLGEHRGTSGVAGRTFARRGPFQFTTAGVEA